MTMTGPAAVTRENLRQLGDMQIDTLASHKSLNVLEIREYLQRSAHIKQLCLELEATQTEVTPVLRPTRKGRRARFQLASK
jgi:hypothetical protein